MSIDLLQDRIRKTKNPTVLVLEAFPDWIPEEKMPECDMKQYFIRLLHQLKSTVPSVRFGFGSFAMQGAAGLDALSELMKTAKELGYYVLLDLPEQLSAAAASHSARQLSREDTLFVCDGVVLPFYAGSEVLKEYEQWLGSGKTVFCVVRTANRSASELQDLLSGNRLVHIAAADIVSRMGEATVGKFGYSQVGALAAASTADSLRTLRAKYKRLFLLLDGADYPNANAKNCSFAFDQLGRGAAACIGAAIVCAWKEAEDQEPEQAALAAAERMKKNLTRYITVL